MAVKFLIFLLPGGCVRFTDDFSEVERADEAHQVLARFLVNFDLGLLRMQFFEERCHAHDAAYAGAGVGFYIGVILENFREVLDHALCDSLMLGHAELGQVACTRGGVFVQELGAFK